MKTYTIDFTGVKCIGDIHRAIQSALGFPAWYGQNLDALWDLLTGYMTPSTVCIRGVAFVPKELAEYMQKVMRVFLDAKKEYGGLMVLVGNA